MAKKQAAFEGEGFPEPPPEEVASAARELRLATTAKTKATNRHKAAKVSLIEAMIAHDYPRVLLDDRSGYYELDTNNTVAYKSIQDDKPAD